MEYTLPVKKTARVLATVKNTVLNTTSPISKRLQFPKKELYYIFSIKSVFTFDDTVDQYSNCISFTGMNQAILYLQYLFRIVWINMHAVANVLP